MSSSVTNNSNNSYDMSDLVWLNQNSEAKLCFPTLYENGLPQAHVLFLPSQLDLFRRVSAPVEKLFGQFTTFVGICVLIVFRFVLTTMKIILEYILWCFLLWSTSVQGGKETVRSLQFDYPHLGR